MIIKKLKEKAAISKKMAVRACAVFTTSALALGLSGCMQGEMTSKIEKDGTVKVSETARIEKAPYDNYMKSAGSSQGEIKKSIKDMKVETIDGIEFYTTSKNVTYKNMESFKKGLISDNAANKVYVASTDTIYYSVDASSDSSSIGGSSTDTDSKTMESILSIYGAKTQYELTYTYEFPEKVTYTNGKIDPENPNKVTFTFNMNNDSKYVFATTSNKKAYYDEKYKGKSTSTKTTSAKKKVALSKKSIKAKVGKNYAIKLKNSSKNAKWTLSNKNATIVKKTGKSVKIKAKKKGTTYVQCKVGSKTYKCKVTIKK